MQRTTQLRYALVVAILMGFAGSSAATEGACTEREININGLSHHFYETNYSKAEGWNEVNGGLGFTCHLDGLGRGWQDEVELGFLRNSHRRTALYGAYGFYYPAHPRVSAGLRLIVANGYRSYVRTNGIIGGPMPTIKFGLSDRLTLNLSLAPKANAFVFANIGLRF